MQNKVLKTDVVRHAITLIALCDKFSATWKRTYRYSVSADLRKNLVEARVSLVYALELDKEFVQEKRFHYNCALAALTNAEADMMEMISPDLCIMTDKQFAALAPHIDDIRGMVGRLVNSLRKQEKYFSGSESANAQANAERTHDIKESALV